MKTSAFILIAVAFGCGISRSQSNVATDLSSVLSIPSLQLRADLPELCAMDTNAEIVTTSPLGPSANHELELDDLRTGETSLPEGGLTSPLNISELSVAEPVSHAESTSPTGQMTATSPILDARTYRYLEANGYLTRPAPESDNGFVRFLSGTFEPEVFHIGKTAATCSIYTAIKRRNPLCLLNPLVLSVSW